MAGTFTLDLSRFAAKAKGRMDIVVRKVALDLLSSVVIGRPVGDGTPVDTGRARGNWMVEIGRLPEGEQISFVKDGGNKGIAGQIAIDNGNQVIGGARTGDVVYIANNVPYITILEYGRDDGTPGSPQAPKGMLRVALRSYPGIVEKAAAVARST